MESDAEDSRTAMVGRKRDHSDLESDQPNIIDIAASPEPASDSEHHLHKRTKQAAQPQFPTQVNWNKGVGGGLRTTFGAKPKQKAVLSVLQNESTEVILPTVSDAHGRQVKDGKHDFFASTPQVVEEKHTSADALSGVMPLVSEPDLAREAPEVSSSQSALNPVQPALRFTSRGGKPTEVFYLGEPGSVRHSFATADEPVATATASISSPRSTEPEEDEGNPSEAKIESSPVSNMPVTHHDKVPKYHNKHGNFILTEMFHNGAPIPIEDIKFRAFLEHFAQCHPEAHNFTAKYLKGAYAQYVKSWYGKASSAAKQHASVLTQSGKEIRAIQKSVLKGLSQNRNYGSMSADNAVAKQDRSMPVTPSGRPLSPDDINTLGEAPESNHEDLQFDDDLVGLELSVQLKYFPPVEGVSTKAHCIVCGETSHKTLDCKISCSVCCGNHTSFTCPQNQICGKCREKGHHSRDCTEKLAAGRDEMVCDLCQSTGHIETACHFIWRSFVPNPEEIKTVRHISIHCFFCGADGHYGPECGLNRRNILSGTVTWSKSSHQKYVDPNSDNVAISSPIDYSLPQPKPSIQKTYNIKGKANDPIVLEDSDEEIVGLIRPSVNKSRQVQAAAHSKGRIHSGIIARPVAQASPPPIRSSYEVYNTNPPPANPTRAQAARPGSAYESARYDRERSFSPPPTQYNNAGSNFPAYPRNQYPTRDTSMNDYYQQAPPDKSYNTINGYQQAPYIPQKHGYYHAAPGAPEQNASRAGYHPPPPPAIADSPSRGGMSGGGRGGPSRGRGRGGNTGSRGNHTGGGNPESGNQGSGRATRAQNRKAAAARGGGVNAGGNGRGGKKQSQAQASIAAPKPKKKNRKAKAAALKAANA